MPFIEAVTKARPLNELSKMSSLMLPTTNVVKKETIKALQDEHITNTALQVEGSLK